jgi:uncharacterized protein (TIGR00645 family)
MRNGFNGVLRAVLFASRWVMAPFCLGLCAGLLIVLAHFLRELWHAATDFPGMSGAEIILAVLKLVDLVLVANLLLMIIVAGVEIFAPSVVENSDRPHAAGIAEFAAYKPRLLASIVAIASVDLLESYINIDSVDKSTVLWEIVIVLGFVVTGVLLACMERLSGERH